MVVPQIENQHEDLQSEMEIDDCAGDQVDDTLTRQGQDAQNTAQAGLNIVSVGTVNNIHSSAKAQENPLGREASSLEKPDHEVDLDEDILSILGPSQKPEIGTGPAIHKEVAARWKEILLKGLSEAEVKKLVEQYPPPKNCTAISAPMLNPAVKASIQEATVTRDNRIVERQKRISVCLTAIGNAISGVLKLEDSQRKEILSHLGTAGQLLTCIQRDEALVRKSLIQANLNTSLRGTLADSVTDQWLFGENLEEKLKAAKELERTSKDLKIAKVTTKPQQPKSTKNLKAPPRQGGYKNPLTAGGNKQNRWNEDKRNDKKKTQFSKDYRYKNRR